MRAIRELLLPDIEMNVPDLNVPSFERLDFHAAVDRAIEAGTRVPPAAIVGSSLGGLMALEVVRRGIRRPLVLIAPALGVAEHWINHVAEGDPVIVYNHARETDAPIHRGFFEQMAGVDADHESPAVPVTLIMGRRDESVPFDRVQSVWRQWEQQGLAEGSKFVDLAEGDHGLTAFAPTIAAEIRRMSG